MRLRRVAAVVALLSLAWSPGAAAAPPKAVASIAPVHALLAAVMEGVAAPTLLLPPGASPHAFALAPSQAAALRQAELVFRVADNLETFLNQPLRGLATAAQVVVLAEADGVRRLAARAGGAWPADDGHGHENGDDGHENQGHEDHGLDPHMWLDPANARAWARAMAAALAEADPANAGRYAANAAALDARLAALEAELTARLRPLAGVPFVVFHDGFQYFERRFGLRAVGAVAVDPERRPGIRSLTDLRRRIAEQGAVCVFAEPQFEPALVATVVEGTGARSGTLDPLGARLQPGPGLYVTLMRELAADLAACLAPA